MKPRIAGDAEIALWVCPTCGNSGTLNIDGAGVYEVIEALSDHHNALSKGLCLSEKLPRLIRPQLWLATAREFMDGEADQSWKFYVSALRKIAALPKAHTAADTAIDIAREALLGNAP